MEMNHEQFMELALQEAETAVKQGEVPIGAVIVKDDRVIAKAHNMREQWLDATAHAEVIAIREACEKLHNWRLSGCTLYVTVEPCPMCAGAIYNSRVDTVIFGCRDYRAGAVESLFNVLSHPLLNHQPQVIGGILEDRCAAVVRDFFADCRAKEK
jgi:tRNA(adenine34) deaminase